MQAQSGLWILRRLFSAGGGDEDVEIQLRGYDLEQSAALAAEIKRRAELAEGIVQAQISRREGRPEEIIRFDRDRIYDLGLSVQEVGRTIQTNVGGSRAGYYREGGEQYPVHRAPKARGPPDAAGSRCHRRAHPGRRNGAGVGARPPGEWPAGRLRSGT